MAIEIPDLTTLDPDGVQAATDYTAQRIAEAVPELTPRRGVTGDIVCRLHAALSQAQSAVIEERVFKGSDLSRLIVDPAAFTEAEADALLGNFRVFRRPGSLATGSAVIVVSRRLPLTVPKGFVFTANGLQFIADEAYAVRISEETVSGANDLLLYANSDGSYSFSISVTAVAEGASGRLKRNTRLTPQGLVSNFVKAYAEGDFDSGSDAESNSEMAARLTAGLAERSPSNRVTLEAMVLAEPAFQGVRASSVIGMGDPEQLRYHTLFPVAHGSRIDYYCRTAATTTSVTLQKACTLVEKSGRYGVWACSIGADDFPGVYRAGRIVRYADQSVDRTGYEIVETLPGFFLPTGEGVPDIRSAAEAAFSPYQTLVVRFLDTDTDASGLEVGAATADYAVDLEGFPLLVDLQAFLANRKRRPPAADILVKAPIPAFVSISCVIVTKAGQPAPDAAAIRSDVVAYVNGRGFSGRLGASALAYVIGRHLTSDHALGAVDMAAEILTPDRGKIVLRSDEALTIPNPASTMISANTVAFIVNSEDVHVSLL